MSYSPVRSCVEVQSICKSCLARLTRTAKPYTRWTRFRAYATGSPSTTRKLPETPARTRFAPSPTGYLHLGSLRTALFNYLIAKATGGQFLLRLEDTDQKRTVQGAEEALYKDLRWIGLQWDEGPEVGGPYGPYRQSERTALYRKHAQELLESGHAYRCFCSQERLQELATRRKALGVETDYDRACAGIPIEEADDRAASGEDHVIRLRAPVRWPVLKDLVYGRVGKTKAGHGRPSATPDKTSFEDPIILKTDGLPTYHLANVVDDHYMKITHVIRATEWLSSTPKHLAIYRAFGWEPPAYAHVGLLVDKEGNKLSKRNQDVDLESYKRQGYFPEALLNYLALLGWSHKQKSDVMDLRQLIESFDMKFTRGNAVADEGKLHFLQRCHAGRRAEAGGAGFEEMCDLVESHVLAQYQTSDELQTILGGRELRDYIKAVIRADSKNYSSPAQFVEKTAYFYCEPQVQDGWKTWIQSVPHSPPEEDILLAVEQFKRNQTRDWSAQTLKQKLAETVSSWNNTRSLNPRSQKDDVIGNTREQIAFNMCFHQCLRAMIAGGMSGPRTSETMAILGRDVTLRRLNRAMELAVAEKQRQEKGG